MEYLIDKASIKCLSGFKEPIQKCFNLGMISLYFKYNFYLRCFVGVCVENNCCSIHTNKQDTLCKGRFQFMLSTLKNNETPVQVNVPKSPKLLSLTCIRNYSTYICSLRAAFCLIFLTEHYK